MKSKGLLLRGISASVLVFAACLWFGTALASGSPWYLDASARSWYRYQVLQGTDLDEAEDQDFQEYVVIFGNKEFAQERSLAISLSGRYEKGLGDTEESTFFRDVTDTFDDSDDFKFYQGYIEVDNPVGPDIFGVKAGRQTFTGAETIRFDGGTVFLQDPGNQFFRIQGFAGQYVSFFDEDEPDEAAWGGDINVHAFPGNELYASLVSLMDYNWSAGIRQRVGYSFFGEAEYRSINGYPRDASVSLLYSYLPWNLTVLASYYNKIGPDEDQEGYDDFLFDYTSTDNNATDYEEYRLDYLYFTPLKPHAEYALGLEIGFLDGRVIPGVGFTRHQLNDSGDEDYYNATYNMFGVSLDIRNLLLKQFSLVLRWEHTDEQRDESDEETQLDDIRADLWKGFFNNKLEVAAYGRMRSYKYMDESVGGESYGATVGYNPCPYFSISAIYEATMNDLYADRLDVDRIDTLVGVLELKY